MKLELLFCLVINEFICFIIHLLFYHLTVCYFHIVFVILNAQAGQSRTKQNFVLNTKCAQ